MSDRQRGVIVQVLDLTPLKPEVIAFFQQNDPTITDVSFSYRWATAVDPKGPHHLICDEGVGWIFSDDDPVEVDVYDATERRNEEGHQIMSTVPIGISRFTPSRLADLPREDVDLADFIRRFGDRLERNFHENYMLLTQESRR